MVRASFYFGQCETGICVGFTHFSDSHGRSGRGRRTRKCEACGRVFIVTRGTARRGVGRIHSEPLHRRSTRKARRSP